MHGADLSPPRLLCPAAAEMTNGRAAMLGLAALLVIEGIKGVALF